MRVANDVTVNVTGIQPDPTATLNVTLGGGWNLLGCPRVSSVALADVQVQTGDLDPETWAQAVTDHLVQRWAVWLQPERGYASQATLQPWQGYWIRVLVPNGVTLVFPASTTTAAVSR